VPGQGGACAAFRCDAAPMVRSRGVSTEFLILGSLDVQSDGVPLELGGPRQRSVLSVLLLHAGEVVPATTLIYDIWGETPPGTAANLLQGYVSDLRKSLGRDTIVTRGPGYALDIEPAALDLHRFERLVAAADGAEPAVAAERLGEALGIWRGRAFADLADVPFARDASRRLEELRLAALERRVDADLALGRHAALTGELEQLVAEHPLRERFRALLMLALYRCGRQAEALEAYQAARRTLVEQLGIEPVPALRRLQESILRHDPELDVPDAGAAVYGQTAAAAARSILVVPRDEVGTLRLVSIAEPLARIPPRELIVVQLLDAEAEPAASTGRLAELRDELVSRGLQMRVAAYTSTAPADDAVLLATEQQVDLLLADAPPSLLEEGIPDQDLDAILRHAPCDVAILLPGQPLSRDRPGPVVVPFGGAEHDWSAIELGAWAARALGTTLRLVGTSADRLRGRRDASRTLARASLVVQAVAGIVAEPALVRGGAEGVADAAADAALLVVGLSGRWQAEGLGPARLALGQRAGVPTLLVRRGLRPGGLAPSGSMTRFTWSLAPAES
jgi:DNA-binding SARP family transcriptional activator